MFDFIVGFAVGAVLGWNVLPQPAWSKNLWDKLTVKLLGK